MGGLQFVSTLAFFTVLFIGIVLAASRWRRHPAVSRLLIGGLGVMLISSVTFRVAVPMILASRGGAPISTVAFYIGLLGIAMTLCRTAAWAVVITAVFGWRTGRDTQPPAAFQFSIRGLILLTFAVALLFGLGRAVVTFFGESAPYLLQFVDDLPVIGCLAIGIWIAAARWQRHPAVSHLAIWAFAVAIAVSIYPQLLWLVLRYPGLIVQINFVASLVSATSWALAIAAALGWRSLDVPFAAGNWRVSDETSRLSVSDVRR